MLAVRGLDGCMFIGTCSISARALLASVSFSLSKPEQTRVLSVGDY